MVDDRLLTRRESLQTIGGFSALIGGATIPFGLHQYRRRSESTATSFEIRLFTDTAVSYQLQYPPQSQSVKDQQVKARRFDTNLNQGEQHVYETNALPSRLSTTGPLRMYVHDREQTQSDRTDITIENDAAYYLETAGTTAPTALSGTPSSTGHSPTRSYVHGQVTNTMHWYSCKERVTAVWVRETGSVARIRLETDTEEPA